MTPPVPAACVMGWPVEHSRSPLIHGYWLERHAIAGAYRREAIRPEEFVAFIGSLRARGYVGGNVTQPHKAVALAHSEPDDRALAVGAANTLWFEGGRLRSTNTDVEGFIASLDTAAPGWERDARKAVVLGAGGAARAVIFGLLERGVERIHVVNRTFERAEDLARRFGSRVVATRWPDLQSTLAGARVLANATNLGMAGHPALEIDLAPLTEDAVVGEVVYVPLRTALLEQAARRRLRAADGLEMLLRQAVRGFCLWFGVEPAVSAGLRALIEADLARR